MVQLRLPANSRIRTGKNWPKSDPTGTRQRRRWNASRKAGLPSIPSALALILAKLTLRSFAQNGTKPQRIRSRSSPGDARVTPPLGRRREEPFPDRIGSATAWRQRDATGENDGTA